MATFDLFQNQLSGNLLRKFKNSNGWQKLWVVFTNFCMFFYKSHQVRDRTSACGGWRRPLGFFSKQRQREERTSAADAVGERSRWRWSRLRSLSLPLERGAEPILRFLACRLKKAHACFPKLATVTAHVIPKSTMGVTAAQKS